VRFYLGTHCPHWLGLLDIPLFVSRRTLHTRSTFPRALGPWVLDSGGFTELNKSPYRWVLTTAQYAAEVELYAREIGVPEWVAPMDWMCEPSVLAKTRLTVADHHRLTIQNFLDLRQRLGSVVAPVIQGWHLDDYQRHVDAYDQAGVDLSSEPIVAIGSVCRRGQDAQIKAVVRSLADLGFSLHAFGVKGTALLDLSDALISADSMAWSFEARHKPPLPGCKHKSCANCLRYALAWRSRIVESLGQLRLEGAAA
jgi:hypothetical protein